ncbi:MAG: hypothetical protein WC860_08885 [Candidatus Margulisiibacteriota bacterium]|jgi:hypothetical protein
MNLILNISIRYLVVLSILTILVLFASAFQSFPAANILVLSILIIPTILVFSIAETKVLRKKRILYSLLPSFLLILLEMLLIFIEPDSEAKAYIFVIGNITIIISILSVFLFEFLKNKYFNYIFIIVGCLLFLFNLYFGYQYGLSMPFFK